MIPDGNIRGDLLSVGIAALNRRLNGDDALSGNVAAGCLPAAPTATRYALIHKPLLGARGSSPAYTHYAVALRALRSLESLGTLTTPITENYFGRLSLFFHRIFFVYVA